MKKFLSILFAVFIILSGMHFSIATHICGGEVAAVKFSFSGKIASCGMIDSKSSTSENVISSGCCKNKVSSYSVDNNYNPTTTYQTKAVTKNIIHLFHIPTGLLSPSYITTGALNKNAIPPDIALTSAVSLADICYFRI